MYRQIRVNKWKLDASPEAIAMLLEALRVFFAETPEVRQSFIGQDVGLDDDHYDTVIINDFDDREAWARYHADPRHRKIVTTQLLPIIDRTALIHCEI